jgi:pSer/pThr/pTyr-binding forkhead associated (FHA) protein
MPSTTKNGAARRPPRDLIAAVLESMRRNLEPLKYSTLAPSRYVVYLHPSEYARIEGIVPILQAQTIRALAEELETLNRRTRVGRYAERMLGRQSPPVQSAGDWHVEFLPDPDGDMAEGDILIDSELMLPARPELGVGEHTRRVTTVHIGNRTSMRERSEEPTGPSPSAPAIAAPPAIPAPPIPAAPPHLAASAIPPPAPTPSTAPMPVPMPALARIIYEDNAGQHSYDVTKDSVTIGRGGVTYPVDIKIASSVDVSREHARIRRDPRTGRFFIIDLSSLGTTLNGRHVPRGYEEVEGNKRENGVETPLPDQARIGLAETVFLNFTAVRS